SEDEGLPTSLRCTIEDMTIRNLAPKTQPYHKKSAPVAAHGGSTFSVVGGGATVFFRVTLGRRDITEHSAFIYEPRKLPVVLSPEEEARHRGSDTSSAERCLRR